MSGLTHLDDAGAARMVDVGDKPSTARQAIARGRILMSDAALSAIREGSTKKGDVIAVARIAGIMGAKRTAELIPLCHPLPLSRVEVALTFDPDGITATATTATQGQTGVEMEALTAVNVTLLTIYDMAKAIDKHMRINDIHLVSKSGGRSGDWHVDRR